MLKLKQIFQKNKALTSKTPLFVIGLFNGRHSICFNIYLWQRVFNEKDACSILVALTKKRYSTFLKKLFVSKKFVSTLILIWHPYLTAQKSLFCSLVAKNLMSLEIHKIKLSNIFRILAGKRHPKIKLHRIRKIRISTFGSLVRQIMSFSEVLKLEAIFEKIN